MAHVPPGGMPFSWAWLGFGVLCAWVVLYHRGLPLYFHLRVLSYVVRAIVRPQPFSRADEEIVLHERVWLSDVDFNIHCNNAVYNNLLDFARFKWFMRLAGDDILGNFSRTKVGNGGVTMFFLRELRPFQPFRIRTRVLGFDRKWVFYMHIFESGRDNKVHALGMSKIVFKERSGKTIAPADLFASKGIAVPAHMAASESAAGEHLHGVLAKLEEAAGPGVTATFGAPSGARTPGPLSGEASPQATEDAAKPHEPTSSKGGQRGESGELRLRKPA